MEEEKKKGLVPEQQISGSDADKAYNENGEFGEASQENDQETNVTGNQEGSDADTDRK